MTKQTNDTLRTWYLHDLKKPDIHHGRTTPKVRRLDQWESIEPMSKHGTFWDATYAVDQASNRNIFLWSDNHYGHKNIIQYTGRPFENAQQMNDQMTLNYLDVVTDNDIVIFCGDVSFMNLDDMNEVLDLLPGYKIQIVGNHDIDRKGKLSNLNFDERHMCLVLNLPDYNYQLLLTHYPLDKVPPNCFNCHGHIHDNVANPWNINVCVEHTEYAPQNLTKVIERMQQSTCYERHDK